MLAHSGRDEIARDSRGDTMNRRIRPMIVAGFIAVGMLGLAAGWPLAQTQLEPQLQPRVIQIDRVTCGEVLGLRTDLQDRLLIFLNGYVSGARNTRIWDEAVQGAMIERALASCRADGSQSALAVFMKASGS